MLTLPRNARSFTYWLPNAVLFIRRITLALAFRIRFGSGKIKMVKQYADNP